MEGFEAHTDWNARVREAAERRRALALREFEIHRQRSLSEATIELSRLLLLQRPDAEPTLPQSPEAKPMSPLTPMLVLSAKTDGGTQDTKGFYEVDRVRDCFVHAMNMVMLHQASKRVVVRVEFYNPDQEPSLFGTKPRAFLPATTQHATGIDLIRAERERQVGNGYHEEHDEQYKRMELALAAAVLLAQYAGVSLNLGGLGGGLIETAGKASEKWFRMPSRRLAIAGAWIAAEIDRLDREIVLANPNLAQKKV